jgi:hypothetical protein
MIAAIAGPKDELNFDQFKISISLPNSISGQGLNNSPAVLL